MSEHTPTPFRVEEGSFAHKGEPIGDGLAIVDNNDKAVALLCQSDTGKDEPNADFMIRACNSHADLLTALESIAKNTCCTTCQEAATVARDALGWRHQCSRCGAWGAIVNVCGCDPNNLPTAAIAKADTQTGRGIRPASSE